MVQVLEKTLRSENKKQLRKSNQIVIYGILFLIVVCFFTLFCVKDLRYNELKEECDSIIKATNRHWEMILNNCGRDEEVDMKNDYCRGFGDGFNYAAENFKINCFTKELDPLNDDVEYRVNKN